MKKSEIIEQFIELVEECEKAYKEAFAEVGKEDRRTQDLLHELEFAKDISTRNKIATKLKNTRKRRREQKDITTENEEIVNFFQEQQNRTTLNKMKELLQKQKRKEGYLDSDRFYVAKEEKQKDFEKATRKMTILKN